MTTADKQLLATKLRRRAYKQEDVDPIQDAIVIGERVKKSSCFGAVVSVLAIGTALALAVFGAKSPAQSKDKRIAELEAFCEKTLDSLNIFIKAVVANDMIVPRWVGDLKDELEELLPKKVQS